ncbi:hypothetical protein BH20ACT21_BH20ACT21_03540 [soil metagenome]
MIGFFYLVSGLLVPLPPADLLWIRWMVLLAVLVLTSDFPRLVIGGPGCCPDE